MIIYNNFIGTLYCEGYKKDARGTCQSDLIGYRLNPVCLHCQTSVTPKESIPSKTSSDAIVSLNLTSSISFVNFVLIYVTLLHNIFKLMSVH